MRVLIGVVNSVTTSIWWTRHETAGCLPMLPPIEDSSSTAHFEEENRDAADEHVIQDDVIQDEVCGLPQAVQTSVNASEATMMCLPNQTTRKRTSSS